MLGQKIKWEQKDFSIFPKPRCSKQRLTELTEVLILGPNGNFGLHNMDKAKFRPLKSCIMLILGTLGPRFLHDEFCKIGTQRPKRTQDDVVLYEHFSLECF